MKKKRRLRKWVKLTLLTITLSSVINLSTGFRKQAIEQCSQINDYNYCVANLG